LSQPVPQKIDSDAFIEKLAEHPSVKNHGVANMNLYVLPPCPVKGQEILIAIEDSYLSLLVPRTQQ
jgi:hypothetical protein